jgi:pyridoxine 4-dehydrogenase
MELQCEGKVRHIGLSEVTVRQIEEMRRMTRVASVQNQYNLAYRKSDVLDHCRREAVSFPGFRSRPATWRTRVGRWPARLPSLMRNRHRWLPWLLRKSPVMLPTPGTSNLKHLEENTTAALLDLDDSIINELEPHSQR